MAHLIVIFDGHLIDVIAGCLAEESPADVQTGVSEVRQKIRNQIAHRKNKADQRNYLKCC